jgi:hypothetical protein
MQCHGPWKPPRPPLKPLPQLPRPPSRSKLILSHEDRQSLFGHHYDLGVHYIPPQARGDLVASRTAQSSPDLECPYLKTDLCTSELLLRS